MRQKIHEDILTTVHCAKGLLEEVEHQSEKGYYDASIDYMRDIVVLLQEDIKELQKDLNRDYRLERNVDAFSRPYYVYIGTPAPEDADNAL